MSVSKRGKRLIFVSGAARSGTTLMQNILNMHQKICGAPEFHHIPDVIGLREKLLHSIDKKWIDIICTHDDVDSAITTFIEDLLLPLADKKGCTYLSEKTPGSVIFFQELLSLFPNAHFIQIVRDPRAVISSMLQVGRRAKTSGWQTQDFTQNTLSAIVYVEKCLSFGFRASKLAPEKILTVVYEELVRNPEIETKRICKFLNIDWSSEMMFPGRKKHLGEKAITNQVWYDTKMFKRDIEKQEINKWKDNLNQFQRLIISLAFKDNKWLVKMGYDLNNYCQGTTNQLLCSIPLPIVKSGVSLGAKTFSLVRRIRRKAIIETKSFLFHRAK